METAGHQISFQEKIILVTGGGSGIGRAAALAFARAEARVVIGDVSRTAGEETVQMAIDQGGKAEFFEADVSHASQVKSLVERIAARHGRLDCAFNNAGVEGELARLADITEADFDRTISTNLKGIWLCMKYEIQHMISRGQGVIVNTASAAGLVGTHSMSVYGASKHGVIGLTKSAAVEYASKGIRINAVCPSVINTPMAERTFAKFPKFEEGIKSMNPSRRLGEPNEVAAAVLWLCSDQASFVNGAALAVDGGFTAQ